MQVGESLMPFDQHQRSIGRLRRSRTEVASARLGRRQRNLLVHE